ncbi:MAG: TonB-dependent receptor [Burkholderiales bacterium]|nr:MAG: TonB-dependent receptor [Burkholderiales bacterium]
MRTPFKTKLYICVAAAVLASGAAYAQEAPAPQTPPGDAADQNADVRGGLDRVIVTAERREVDLSEIPVAISAFTSDTLETVGIDTVSDLANFTPGLAHSLANDRLTVRGIGRFTNTRATEGGVAIYLDGFYTSTASGLQRSDLYVDRFEVLRGPQGTLYGRNSVGGAVNLISKRPSDEFKAEVRAIISNYDRQEFEAMVTGPITDNIRYRIAGNKTDQRDGYWKNISTVGTGTDEGMVEDRSYYELQLEGELFGDNVEWWIKYGMERWNNSGGGTTGRASSTFGLYNNFSAVTGTTPNLLYGFGNGQRPENTDMREIRSWDRTPVVQDLPHVVGHLTFHLPNFDLKYVGGYESYNYYSDGPANGLDRVDPFTLTRADFPGSTDANSPIPLGQSVVIDPRNRNLVQQHVWWHSNELNLASTYDGPVQILAGIYQYNEGANDYLSNVYSPFQSQYENVRYLDGTAAPPSRAVSDGATGSHDLPNRMSSTSGADTVTETYAAYAQVDWQFTDELKAVAGLRYTLDKKEVYERARILCFLGSLCAAQGRSDLSSAWDVSALVYNPDAPTLADPRTAPDPSVVIPTFTNATTGFRERKLEQEWDEWTWTAGLDWQPSTDTLVYGKYTKGYKAGGFNSGTLTRFTTTEPENVYLYELGVKQTFGNTLQVNGALYYQDYQKMQIPLTVLNTNTNLNESRFVNMPKSEISGVELEATWNPISTLQIMANYSYLKTEIKEACCFQDPQDPTATRPGADPAGPNGVQDLAGNELPFATPHRVTINANYTWDFDTGSLTPSLSAVYKSETYYSVFNRFYNQGKAGTQFDARLLWRDADDKYTIIGFIRNISNQTLVEGVSASILAGTNAGGVPLFLNRTWSLNPPRTYGVELQYRF